MFTNSKPVGAIVVGGEHPGLGVARSLGRRGIPVCVIDDQHSVSQFSRYVTRVVRVKDLRDEQNTVDAVLEIGKRYGMEGWVLYPTRDETVAAFSRHRDCLAKFFRVTTPAWDTVRWAWDKKNTYDLAEELGIPVPHTYNPRSEAELVDLFGRLPLALKPAVKENFFYATGDKAWRAETPEELVDIFRKAQRQIRPEEILIQEIIPGDGQQQYSYCAFFRNGEAHSTLLAKRIRQHPREFGRAATYVETIDFPEIEELSERFLRAIDYYGLVEVEFKRDPRDGQFKLLDVNARTWGFHSIGIPAGVDFPYLLFADQTGASVERSRGRAGVGWLRMVTDVPTFLVDLWDRELNLPSYWSSLKNTRAESVFCARDPLPSLAEIVMLPYLVTKKYFVKPAPPSEMRAAEEEKTACRVPAMNEAATTVRNISDTARWVAYFRARETERADALFRDPYAELLAGERGFHIANTLPDGNKHEWAWVARTYLFDNFLSREIKDGTTLVVNLAAGLDARPYRMDIPSTLQWVEVDLPEIISYKDEVLANEKPKCKLERVSLDLSDGPARRKLFADLNGRSDKIVFASEGLLIYFTPEEVASLSLDIAATEHIRSWVIDLASPGQLKLMQRSTGKQLSEAGAPFKFGPSEGANFFTAQGWEVKAVEGMLKTAAQCNRAPAELLSLLPEPKNLAEIIPGPASAS